VSENKARIATLLARNATLVLTIVVSGRGASAAGAALVSRPIQPYLRRPDTDAQESLIGNAEQRTAAAPLTTSRRKETANEPNHDNYKVISTLAFDLIEQGWWEHETSFMSGRMKSSTARLWGTHYDL
jgi:hypothetical protein